MKRRDLLKTATAAATLALPNIGAAQGSKTIKFVPQADLALLDPVFTSGLVTRNHGMMVYDQLYGLDESFTPQQQMAEGHVVENDGKTWKITLREGLKFHDGTPVLARDTVASIDRWTQIDVFGQNVRADRGAARSVPGRIDNGRPAAHHPRAAASGVSGYTLHSHRGLDAAFRLSPQHHRYSQRVSDGPQREEGMMSFRPQT
jgi:ABC-type transport system substrate-binding protein